jgi:hypothetical protein
MGPGLPDFSSSFISQLPRAPQIRIIFLPLLVACPVL